MTRIATRVFVVLLMAAATVALSSLGDRAEAQVPAQSADWAERVCLADRQQLETCAGWLNLEFSHSEIRIYDTPNGVYSIPSGTFLSAVATLNGFEFDLTSKFNEGTGTHNWRPEDGYWFRTDTTYGAYPCNPETPSALLELLTTNPDCLMSRISPELLVGTGGRNVAWYLQVDNRADPAVAYLDLEWTHTYFYRHPTIPRCRQPFDEYGLALPKCPEQDFRNRSIELTATGPNDPDAGSGYSASGVIQYFQTQYRDGTMSAPAPSSSVDFYYPDGYPPFAYAGPDQSVDEGQLVSLEGAGSSDAVNYQWTQTAGPTVPLSSYTTTTPDFVAAEGGTNTVLTFDLVADDGTEAVSYPDSVNVTVNNVAPVVTASGGVVDESGVATVSGTITDPGTLDTFEVVIDWGDGTPMTYPYPAGTTVFSETHQYLDDDPTGTGSDVYPIGVTATDDDGGVGTAGTTVTVNNVAPVVTRVASSATFEARAAEGEAVTISGAFTDVGTLDTHTVLIDWDEEDGTTSAGVVIQGSGTGTFTGSHSYASGGVYTVTVTVTDDDTGTTTATTTTVVIGVGVNDGELQIIGTDEKDHIEVNREGNAIEVKTDFGLPKEQQFAVGAVTSVLAMSFGDDDLIQVSKKVQIAATLVGGPGRDHLDAGDGPTVLMGGGGDDKLLGGGASDLLIGGGGEDDLKGRNADDVLIGGTTSADDDHSALPAVMAEWTSGRLFNATVIDDNASDKLNGDEGIDWYFADLDGLDGDDDTIKLNDDDLLQLL